MSIDNGMIISQVTFGEGGLEIVYLEAREQSPKVGIVRTVIYEIDEEVEPRVDDVIDSLEEILDEALVKLRNPSRHRDAKDRARAMMEAQDDDEDDR